MTGASPVGVSAERRDEMREVADPGHQVGRGPDGRRRSAARRLLGSWYRAGGLGRRFIVLTTEASRYAADDAWLREPALDEVIRVQAWGPITEWRHVTASGLEVELNIGSPDWARTEPVDAGTRRVVSDGARILHDPVGVLAELVRACA